MAGQKRNQTASRPTTISIPVGIYELLEALAASSRVAGKSAHEVALQMIQSGLEHYAGGEFYRASLKGIVIPSVKKKKTL